MSFSIKIIDQQESSRVPFTIVWHHWARLTNQITHAFPAGWSDDVITITRHLHPMKCDLCARWAAEPCSPLSTFTRQRPTFWSTPGRVVVWYAQMGSSVWCGEWGTGYRLWSALCEGTNHMLDHSSFPHMWRPRSPSGTRWQIVCGTSVQPAIVRRFRSKSNNRSNLYSSTLTLTLHHIMHFLTETQDYVGLSLTHTHMHARMHGRTHARTTH